MKRHVLIIDDSLTETRVFKAALESHGYQVSIACNGQEGIEVAQACRPDIILMDVVMPLLNGFQATRELTQSNSTAHIPIIMCSSKNAKTDRLWALRQGAKDYLIKPVRTPELLHIIKLHLSRAGGYEQSV